MHPTGPIAKVGPYHAITTNPDLIQHINILIVLFALIFLFALAFISNASRKDIFSAVAAFVAVQVVFIGITNDK